MKTKNNSVRSETRIARQLWPDLEAPKLRDLRSLLLNYQFSILRGDVTRIDNKWFVTHSGLLRLASRRKCRGISTFLQERLCDPATNRWVFRAVVYKGPKSKGFVGYGDATPDNTSSLVHGSEMRVAETRAVNRALRKAYGIGLCSVEELGAFSSVPKPAASAPSNGSASHFSNGAGHNQPRLRDRLCILIRQFELNPNLVKAYAADFCGTEVLSGASRELVESFISHLATAAKENRDALICKLNSYEQPAQAKS